MERFYQKLNTKQRESLASFFNSIAVGWFLALFSVPFLGSQIPLLTMIQLVVNIVGALYISLYFLRNVDTYESK